MAAKKSRGLGRGLDALFGDMEVDILKNDNEDTPKVEESSTDANKPSAGSAAKEQPAVPKMQQKLRNPMDQYKMWILLQEVSFISISMI